MGSTDVYISQHLSKGSAQGTRDLLLQLKPLTRDKLCGHIVPHISATETIPTYTCHSCQMNLRPQHWSWLVSEIYLHGSTQLLQKEIKTMTYNYDYVFQVESPQLKLPLQWLILGITFRDLINNNLFCRETLLRLKQQPASLPCWKATKWKKENRNVFFLVINFQYNFNKAHDLALSYSTAIPIQKAI